MCLAHAMSRGLGTTQRTVIEYLHEQVPHATAREVQEMLHKERGVRLPIPGVYRLMASLRSRGLVLAVSGSRPRSWALHSAWEVRTRSSRDERYLLRLGKLAREIWDWDNLLVDSIEDADLQVQAIKILGEIRNHIDAHLSRLARERPIPVVAGSGGLPPMVWLPGRETTIVLRDLPRGRPGARGGSKRRSPRRRP